ncbi:PerC family transcriptional regulator, partial [Salmonella enterica subsp. enterica serovar Montevideo]|nr:PerC family transcriptional regulator [Salmonella enterica subsp. enterica serovar Montevideo]
MCRLLSFRHVADIQLYWRRASTRWLLVMGDFECTEAQREWLLLRRNYCLAQISSPGA